MKCKRERGACTQEEEGKRARGGHSLVDDKAASRFDTMHGLLMIQPTAVTPQRNLKPAGWLYWRTGCFDFVCPPTATGLWILILLILDDPSSTRHTTAQMPASLATQLAF